MGTDDAETLMEQLPPSGWDNVATKDDLKVLTATFTAALAEMRVEFTDALAGIASELADTRVEFTDALADIKVAHAESHAELVKSQARHLYITVSTVVLATISIWIALLAVPAGG